MSLFPAYSSSSAVPSATAKTTTVKDNPTNDGYGAKDWLSLTSFDDKKVIELNNEIIIVDNNTTAGSDAKQSDRKSGHKTKKNRKEKDRSRSDERSKHRSSRDRKHRSPSPPPKTSNESLAQFLSNKTFIEETGLSPQNAYRIDTKKDKNNLAFNSLYFKNVANYDKNKTINISKRKRDTNDDSKKSHKNKKMRYFSLENRVLMKKCLKDLKDMSQPEMKPMGEPLEFIAINDNQPFRQLLSTTDSNANPFNPLGVYDTKTALWSEGKGCLDDIPLPESSIKFKSMIDKKVTIGVNRCPTREQHIYDKTQEFNCYLKDNECDVEKWMKFIVFQDKCVETEDDVKDKIEGKTYDVFVAEKKLSICEKALSFNPKSIELLLCRLEIVSNIWDFDKVVKEWKRLVFLYPNSLEMWRKYLRFSHQNITYFKVSKTVKIYEKCVQMLSKMLEKTFISHTPPKNLEQELVLILSSYSQFLQSIGQTERAVATFQALIEFNLFTPSLLIFEMSFQDWKTLFEPFWDSGCPRFGENGSIGWSQVMAKKNVEKSPENDSQFDSLIDREENQIIGEKSNKNIVWLKFEILRQRFHWLPEKSDSNVEDIERIVCSDDVMEMLVRLREPNAKYLLVKEFLRFLSVIDTKTDENYLNSDDNFEQNVKISNFSICLPLLPQFYGNQTIIQNIFKSGFELFSGENKCDFVLNWIQYEKCKTSDKMSAKEMRKFLKNFLRDELFRNDLNVWSEYVSFEYSMADNPTESRKVFRNAIEFMLKSNQNSEQLFKFVRNYVELEFDIKCLSLMSDNIPKQLEMDSIAKDLCLNSLLSISCGQLVSNSTPNLVLKALNTLRQVNEPTINHLFCLIFINYLTKGLRPTIDLIEEILVEKHGLKYEKQLFIIYCQILLVNSRQTSGQSLKVLRGVLGRALDLYPTDPQFLSLFVNIEFMSRVFCRMRRFFAKTYQTVRNDKSFTDNLNLILYAIHAELRRMDSTNEIFTGYDTNTGIINRVRLLFERAVTSAQLSNCVTLWRLYIKFELNCNNTSKAKSVFYRALQTCSYSKMLYLDGIQYFSSQLQELLDIMTEKEIKIRTPLEEIDLLIDNLK